MISNEISRRNFLKLTASAGVAISIGGASERAYAGAFQCSSMQFTQEMKRQPRQFFGLYESLLNPKPTR
jgi:TAT (twin-arginine translocation) pathway signal sequence